MYMKVSMLSGSDMQDGTDDGNLLRRLRLQEPFLRGCGERERERERAG